MKAFYIQTNENNIITDVVEQPTAGYVVHFTELLPVGVHGGWFKLIDDVIVEVVELNPTNIENRIKAEIDAFTELLLEMGML